MRRREFLAGVLAAVPAVAGAHTPYGQWVTYRRKHLLIGCHRGDPVTYDLAKDIVSRLEASLPDAKARVARAPRAQRLASLMGTEQLDIAVMAIEDAIALAGGIGPFAPYGEIPVGVLAMLPEGKVLIARRDFRADHAWLIARALSDTEQGGPVDDGPMPLDWHDGADLWRKSEPMPHP